VLFTVLVAVWVVVSVSLTVLVEAGGVIVSVWVSIGGVSVIVSVLVIVLVLVLTGRFLVMVVVFCGKTTGKGVIVSVWFIMEV